MVNRNVGPQNDIFTPRMSLDDASPEEIQRYRHDSGVDYDVDEYCHSPDHCRTCRYRRKCIAATGR